MKRIFINFTIILIIVGALAVSSKAQASKGDFTQLKPGQEIKTDKGRLVFDPNGRLMLFKSTGGKFWETIYKGAPVELKMQEDGNLVLYAVTQSSPTPSGVWSTKTEGHPGAYVKIDWDLYRLVVYDKDGKELWASATLEHARALAQSDFAVLNRGEEIKSDKGRLVFQPNSILQLIDAAGKVLWQTNTPASAPTTVATPQGAVLVTVEGSTVRMQDDGNLVLNFFYNRFNEEKAQWTSNTAGHPGAYVKFDWPNNRLAVYDKGGKVLWATRLTDDEAKAEAEAKAAAARPQPGDHMVGGKALVIGESLIPAQGQGRLELKSDRLSLVDANGVEHWHLEAGSHAFTRLAMLEDGNLFLYNALSDLASWNTGTGGNPGAYLQVDWAGGVMKVISKDGSKTLWRSGFLQGELIGDRMTGGLLLNVGQSFKAAAGQGHLELRADRLAFFDANGVEQWSYAPPQAGKSFTRVVMEEDGNFSLYDKGGSLWSTKTNGNAGATMQFGWADGVMRVMSKDGSKTLWRSGYLQGELTGDHMSPGMVLRAGQMFKPASGQARLELKSDRLLLVDASGVEHWHLDAQAGNPFTRLTMQADGNFSLSDKGGSPWSSKTGGNNDAYMQFDWAGGVMRVMGKDGSKVLWRSGSSPQERTGDRMNIGVIVNVGESFKAASGQGRLELKADRLVFFDTGGVERWSYAPPQSPIPFTRAALADDGNFVVFDKGGNPLRINNKESGAYMQFDWAGGVMKLMNGNGSEVFWASDGSHEAVIRIATQYAKNSPWGKALADCATAIGEYSVGRVQVQIYYSGSQGDEDTIVGKMKEGKLDGAVLTAVGLSNIYKPILALQMPGLFTSWSKLDGARNALKGEFEKGLNDAGFTLTSWADFGVSRVMSRGIAVKSPDDLQGKSPLLLRNDPIQSALYQTIGGITATPRSVSEVLSQLNSGTINLVFASALSSDQLQWTPRLDHLTANAQAYVVGGIVISSKRLNALKPEWKIAVLEKLSLLTSLMTTRLRSEDDAAFNRLKGRMAVTDLTSEEQAKWNELYKQVRQRLGQGTFSPDLIRKLESLAK